MKGFPEATFILSESSGGRALQTLLFEWEYRRRADGSSRLPLSQPFVPLETSLPIMVDILRAAAAMEEWGVAHSDISEKSIFLQKEDRGRVPTARHPMETH